MIMTLTFSLENTVNERTVYNDIQNVSTTFYWGLVKSILVKNNLFEPFICSFRWDEHVSASVSSGH